MAVDLLLFAVLRNWKQTTQFGAEGDWVFASPVKVFRLAAKAACNVVTDKTRAAYAKVVRMALLRAWMISQSVIH
jgi:hypothetical protein